MEVEGIKKIKIFIICNRKKKKDYKLTEFIFLIIINKLFGR